MTRDEAVEIVSRAAEAREVMADVVRRAGFCHLPALTGISWWQREGEPAVLLDVAFATALAEARAVLRP